MNVEERMRIADDLHRMAYRLSERTLYLSCEAEIFGSGEDDAELRMLHRRFAGLTRDWLTKYPQESRVRTPEGVQSGSQMKGSAGAGNAPEHGTGMEVPSAD